MTTGLSVYGKVQASYSIASTTNRSGGCAVKKDYAKSRHPASARTGIAHVTHSTRYTAHEVLWGCLWLVSGTDAQQYGPRLNVFNSIQ